jgi:hypothetical protein
VLAESQIQSIAFQHRFFCNAQVIVAKIPDPRVDLLPRRERWKCAKECFERVLVSRRRGRVRFALFRAGPHTDFLLALFYGQTAIAYRASAVLRRCKVLRLWGHASPRSIIKNEMIVLKPRVRIALTCAHSGREFDKLIPAMEDGAALGLAGCGKTLVGAATSVRARLQSCRKCRRINVGFSPCGMLLARSDREFPFFRSFLGVPSFCERIQRLVGA